MHSNGEVMVNSIVTPNHDGWDNSLAFDASGMLHQASINPLAFGAPNSLQHGTYDGNEWNYDHAIEGSGAAMYGFNTSVDIDSQGRVHIAYCKAADWTAPGDLVHAVLDDGDWKFTLVATDGIRGRFPSLVVDGEDRPHISWLDIDSLNHATATVQYGMLDGEEWVIETVLIETEDTYMGMVVMRLDPDDTPGMVIWQTMSGEPGLVRFIGPREASFAITSARLSPDGSIVELIWSKGSNGAGYVVQGRNSLKGGEWEDISDILVANIWSEAIGDQGDMRFYRVRNVE